MTFVKFVTNKLGGSWLVVDRRTKKLRQRYPGWRLLTRKQFKALKAEYETVTGQPAP